jgi:hypothetical protein
MIERAHRRLAFPKFWAKALTFKLKPRPCLALPRSATNHHKPDGGPNSSASGMPSPNGTVSVV